MPFLGVKISAELGTLINEEVKRSEKSKSDIARDALNQYFNVAIPEGTGLIVLDKNELIKLIDSKLGVKLDVKREGKTVKPEVKPEVKPTTQRLSEDLATQERIKELWRGGERNREAIAQQVGYKARTVQQYIKDCLESGELEK